MDGQALLAIKARGRALPADTSGATKNISKQ